MKYYPSIMHPSWHSIIPEERLKEAFFSLGDTIPSKGKIFNAFQMPMNKVRICLIMDKPYNKGATGWALAVDRETEYKDYPPELKMVMDSVHNTYIPDDVIEKFLTPDLALWKDQGVFLLNAALSHDGKEAHSTWRGMTIRILQELNKLPVIFIYLGDTNKLSYVTENNYYATLEEPFHLEWEAIEKEYFTQWGESFVWILPF